MGPGSYWFVKDFKNIDDEELHAMDSDELAELRTEMAEVRSEMAEERTQEAEQRTEWAKHRTLLANERNFSAWIRTGFAAIGGGLAVAEFLDGGDSPIARIVGTILIGVGVAVCGLALWRYNQISDVMQAEGLRVTPQWVVYLVVGGLTLAALLMLVLIILR
jgi:putative membrane protein